VTPELARREGNGNKIQQENNYPTELDAITEKYHFKCEPTDLCTSIQI